MQFISDSNRKSLFQSTKSTRFKATNHNQAQAKQIQKETLTVEPRLLACKPKTATTGSGGIKRDLIVLKDTDSKPAHSGDKNDRLNNT